MSCSITWTLVLALSVGVGAWYSSGVNASLKAERNVLRHAEQWRVPFEVAHQVKRALKRKVPYE